jgi:hypothetical protein
VITCFDNQTLAITGKVFRIARLRDEPYECIETPQNFVEKLKQSDVRADLFTFMQQISESKPKHPFHVEWERLAILPVTTYDDWWKRQINDKTRNMVRKAQKSGVEIRLVQFNDDLIHGIREIYNEAPIRQGKPFKHYGKDFAAIGKDHATFSERSDFIGAFCGQELVGFAKLVHGKNVASLMQIISKISARDKAPTNALIAKSVELCAERNIPYLHYGIWSIGGLGAFKKSHAFISSAIPRYFVPLNLKGRLMLQLKLHRKITDYLPEQWLARMTHYRGKLQAARYRRKVGKGAVAQLVERRGQT